MPNTLSLNSILLVTLALTSFLSTVLLLVRTRRLKRSLAELENRLNDSLADVSSDVDKVSRKSGEHGRRIAWLETRLRQRAEAEPENLYVASQNTKPTITERRHRVLTLARQGRDARAIAQKLNMPHGEVELMLNLHAA